MTLAHYGIEGLETLGYFGIEGFEMSVETKTDIEGCLVCSFFFGSYKYGFEIYIYIVTYLGFQDEIQTLKGRALTLYASKMSMLEAR